MANLAGQKTFLDVQQQISELVLRKTIADTSTQPTLTRLKAIINDAYLEVCTEVEWSWRFKDSGTFNTVANQTTPYVMPDTVEEVFWMTIPAYQQKLWYASYGQWLVNYPGKFTNVSATKPWAYIEGEKASNNALQFYLFPQAAQVYTVNYGYMLRITPLSGDTDIMICSPEMQDIVVNRAIRKVFEYLKDAAWQLYDDAPDKDTQASRRYSAVWQRDQHFTDWVATFRNMRAENAFTSTTDINRQLFVPF